MPLIALDFDGTLVENHPDFPQIGADNGAGPWLAEAAAAAEEVRFALYTVRTGAAYEAAAAWCRQHLAALPWLAPQPPVPPLGVKLRAQLYIDDKALGAPLKQGANGRPCVDWTVAGPLMLQEIYRRKRASVPAAAQEEPAGLTEARWREIPRVRYLGQQLARARQIEATLQAIQQIMAVNAILDALWPHLEAFAHDTVGPNWRDLPHLYHEVGLQPYAVELLRAMRAVDAKRPKEQP